MNFSKIFFCRSVCVLRFVRVFSQSSWTSSSFSVMHELSSTFIHRRQLCIKSINLHMIWLIQCMYWKFMFVVHFTDPRTKPWLLSGTPGPLFTILGTYLYFCLYAGPKYMKDRKPFELKKTLIIYNVVQVILSVVLVIEVSFS